LYVGTLEHAEAFYHRALGFDKTAWTYPGALFFGADGYHHHLGTNIWAAGAPPAADGDARLLEWELVLPGADAIDDAAQSLSDAGHEVIVDGADRLSADPWGTVLRIRS
jgi:catechol 2,3-dioxygenase